MCEDDRLVILIVLILVLIPGITIATVTKPDISVMPIFIIIVKGIAGAVILIICAMIGGFILDRLPFPEDSIKGRAFYMTWLIGSEIVAVIIAMIYLPLIIKIPAPFSFFLFSRR